MIKTKIKSKKSVKKEITPKEAIKITNYLNLSILIRVLSNVYDWNEEQLAGFVEAYLSLMQEVADKRETVKQSIKDTYDLTGIDVKALIDSLDKEMLR